jgi:hypothetical protein
LNSVSQLMQLRTAEPRSADKCDNQASDPNVDRNVQFLCSVMKSTSEANRCRGPHGFLRPLNDLLGVVCTALQFFRNTLVSNDIKSSSSDDQFIGRSERCWTALRHFELP